jgi:alpha-tubulin suppressor-like RCC1 family protein
MNRIVTLLKLGALFSLSLLAFLFTGNEARAAAPEVKSFVIPASHRTLTVPVIRFMATDDVAITGYMITESLTAPLAGDEGWTVAPPAKYSFSDEGSKTLYAWVKDADGIVSTSLSTSTVVGSGEAMTKTAIAAGGFHSVALKSDGTVAAWGDNDNGQTRVPQGLTDVVAIAAGVNHTVALKSDGTVTAWGTNDDGQSTIPTPIPGGLSDVVAIATGWYHTVALKSDGTITAWGSNTSGRTTIPGGLTNVVAIAAGAGHTVALKSDGTVTAWGSNIDGQTTIPAGLDNVVAIAAGMNHTVALKSDGTVVAWGWNYYGQTTIPIGLANVVAIAAGQSYTVALKSDGTIAAWGTNEYGQSTIPTGLTNVNAIAAGWYHTVALKSDGTVTAWGWNNYGQTTIPPADMTSVVALAAGRSDHWVALRSDGTVTAWGSNDYGQTTIPEGLTDVVAIDAGYEYTVALKSNGTVVSWGRNTYGQTTVPGGLTNVKAIAAGWYHTVALKSDGTVVAWGDSSFGETTVPAGLTNVVAIAAGGHHTVALKSDGTVTAWGYNTQGQTSVPAGLANVVAIAAGSNHSVALKSDGTVAAWSDYYNSFGETTVPAGLTNVVAIAAGSYHTAALKSDGTVTEWGYNADRQTAAGLTNVVAIDEGGLHKVALKSDGTVMSWGWYNFSESFLPPAGPDTTAPVVFRFSPAPLSTLSEVTIPAFYASDDTGVAGYLITESATPPSASDPGWKVAPPAFYAVGTAGTHTLYAWVKDAAGNISSPAIATVVSEDTIPAAFGFTAVTNAGRGVLYTSNAATVADINVPADISVSGGEYSVNGGPYTSTNGTVMNGDQVTVRQTSSANFSTQTDVVLTIGGVSGIFSVMTLAADTTPDAFTFLDQASVPLNTVVTSNTIIVTGINTDTVISITGGAYSVNGGAYTSNAGVVANGATVSVRVTSSVTYSATTNATLTIGGVSGIFSVTTLAVDTTPDAFTFIDQAGVPLNTVVTSNTIIVTGINTNTAISITGGTYSVNGGSYVSTAGTVMNGAMVRVRVTSSAKYSVTTNATLTIGGVSDTFSVATSVDTMPDAFTFTPQTNVLPGVLVTSNTITVTGINSAATVTVIGGTYSVNGGAFTKKTGKMNNNALIRVSIPSSPDYNSAATATLLIGGVSADFIVTTVDFVGDSLDSALDTAPAANPAITWSTGGDNPWFGENVFSKYGGSAAQSGKANTPGSTWLETTVTGTFTVSFFQKVSSQSGRDFLHFSIDGVEKSKIGGNVNWQQKSYSVTTGTAATVHTLRWTYTKDATIAAGADAGWIDMVRITHYAKLTLTTPNGGEVYLHNSHVNITWNAPAKAEKFKLYYSLDGRTWNTITPDYVTGTSFDWTVPSIPSTMTTCKVKVEAYPYVIPATPRALATDMSNAAFTIQVPWTKQLGVSGRATSALGVSVDPMGNVYVTGYTTGGLDGNVLTGTYDLFVTKYDTSGNKVRTKQLGAAGANTTATGIAVDSNSNVYIAGYTLGGLDGNGLQGYVDLFITKYDQSGNKIYTKQLGGPARSTIANGVAVDPSGNVYAAGNVSGWQTTGSTDLFVAELDASENWVRTRQLGAANAFTEARGVAVDKSGNVYVAGPTGGGLDGNILMGTYDVFITKYDPSGNKMYTKQLGVSGKGTYANGIAVDKSGSMYVAGSTNGGLDGNMLTGTTDVFVTKYDPSGNKIYTKQHGVSGKDTYASDVAVDPSGNVYVAGYTYGGLDGNILTGTYDLFLTRYDPSGNKMYTKQLGVSGKGTYANGVAVDKSGNMYVAGSTNGGLDGNSLQGTCDFFIAKYDPSGNKQ